MKYELLETYQKEMSNLSMKRRKSESPIACLQFKDNRMQEMIDTLRASHRSVEIFNDYNYYPVYPSFKRTIALLKKCDIDVESLPKTDDISDITLSYRGYWEDGRDIYEDYTEEYNANGRELIVSDRAQIRQIMRSSFPSHLNYTNRLNEKYEDIDIEIRVPQRRTYSSSQTQGGEKDAEQTRNGSYDIYYRQFDADRMPQFVVDKFNIQGAR